MNHKETLQKRGEEYGNFTYQASMSQRIEDILREGDGWARMHPFEREAMKMIIHKATRLANGNPHSVDGWHDIGGYAKLVEDRLNQPTTSAVEYRTGAEAAAKAIPATGSGY